MPAGKAGRKMKFMFFKLKVEMRYGRVGVELPDRTLFGTVPYTGYSAKGNNHASSQ